MKAIVAVVFEILWIEAESQNTKTNSAIAKNKNPNLEPQIKFMSV